MRHKVKQRVVVGSKGGGGGVGVKTVGSMPHPRSDSEGLLKLSWRLIGDFLNRSHLIHLIHGCRSVCVALTKSDTKSVETRTGGNKMETAALLTFSFPVTCAECTVVPSIAWVAGTTREGMAVAVAPAPAKTLVNYCAAVPAAVVA